MEQERKDCRREFQALQWELLVQRNKRLSDGRNEFLEYLGTNAQRSVLRVKVRKGASPSGSRSELKYQKTENYRQRVYPFDQSLVLLFLKSDLLQGLHRFVHSIHGGSEGGQ